MIPCQADMEPYQLNIVPCHLGMKPYHSCQLDMIALTALTKKHVILTWNIVKHVNLTWNHVKSTCLTWFHVKLTCLTYFHVKLTWFHVNMTWNHVKLTWNPIKMTWFHVKLTRLTWCFVQAAGSSYHGINTTRGSRLENWKRLETFLETGVSRYNGGLTIEDSLLKTIIPLDTIECSLWCWWGFEAPLSPPWCREEVVSR